MRDLDSEDFDDRDLGLVELASFAELVEGAGEDEEELFSRVPADEEAELCVLPLSLEEDEEEL